MASDSSLPRGHGLSRRVNFWLLIGAWFTWIALGADASSAATPGPWMNTALSPERRAKLILAAMTLEEKLSQLRSSMEDPEAAERLAAVPPGNMTPFQNALPPREAADKYNRAQKRVMDGSRLGIPFLLHEEAVVGLKENGATAFPQPLARAATFDVDNEAQVAQVIVAQTKSRGIRQVLSPTLNVLQDPRWGRAHETYGEDPFLVGELGKRFISTFEQAGIITTPKHFVANHGEQGRNLYPVGLGERYLREYHFPPFRAAIVDAKASSLMPAYNTVEGIPCSGNDWLLGTVLRREWGFKGFVVSDYGAIPMMVGSHGVVADKKHAAKLALESGVDVELPTTDAYGVPLDQAIKERLVSMKTVDDAARRVLTAKFRVGLFDKPFVDATAAAGVHDTSDQRALARKTEQKAIVLLKNAANTLPLDPKKLRTVALMGPLASEVRLGNYAPWGTHLVTVEEALRGRLPNARVRLERGAELEGVAVPALPSEWLRPPNDGQWKNAHGLRGEYFGNSELKGRPAVVRLDPAVDFNWANGIPDPKIEADHFSVRWTGTVTFPESKVYSLGVTRNDGARLWIDGKLILDKWSVSPAVLERVAFRAEKGRPYDLRLEYYEDGNVATVRLGAELNLEAEVQKAVAAAKGADVAIVVVGSLDGEGQDRARLALAPLQERLIKQVAATGTPTVVVLQTGNVVAMASWIADADAVLEAWYPGEEAGNAIVDVLLGAANPAGRLPVTFARETGQIPNYYNMKPPATPERGDYIDAPGTPLFPFGFGLSYTRFVYGALRLSSKQGGPSASFTAEVDVRNAGDRPGDEVVQLYVRRRVSSVAQPWRQLRGFKRVALAVGESKTVSFTLGAADLGLWDRRMRWAVEPGPVDLLVGASSTDVRAREVYTVVTGASRSPN